MISNVFILYYWDNMKRFVEDALLETNTNKVEYWEDKLARDCQKAYQRIRREITQVHEDFFWNYWITDIQAWANEYEIQREWVTVNEWEEDEYVIPWTDKVKKVYIKQWDRYVELPQLSDWEEREWVKGWTLKDNHIILNWIPDEDIEDWIKLEGTCIINQPDWTEDEDADIFPNWQELDYYKPIIATNLKITLWRHKQDFEKEGIAKQDYQEELAELKRFITERVQWIYYTNLTY